MPILSRDIDPAIALALNERVVQLISAPPAPLEGPGSTHLREAGIAKWRETVRRNSYHYWAAGASFLGGIGCIPILATHGPGVTIAALLGMQALAAGLVVRGRNKSRHELTHEVRAEWIRSVGEFIALTPAEASYCAGVASLIEASRSLPRSTQAEILHELNELLSSFRKLDGPIRQYLAAGGIQSLQKLEQELDDLLRRRELQSDPTACATMDQSIQLCQQRLADARILTPTWEQALAQQELILQAMASVHASLSRIAVADSVEAPVGVMELQRTVQEVNQRTRSVEEAVNEVLLLRR